MTEQKSILLVEGNASDESLILRAFARANLANQVVVLRDGQQALDYLFGEGVFAGRASSNPPAVVLLDLQLPRIRGMDVLDRLRSDPRTRLLPVVLLTASNEEEDRLRGYERGANSFVQKPLDFAEFAEKVTHLGVYWLAVNAPPPVRGSRG